jgi:hypothetical protein
VVLVFGSYQVMSAHYLLTSTSRKYEGDLPVNGENELKVRIGGIVAADDYNLIVTADSSDATVTCRGAAGPFSVNGEAPAKIALGFSCIRSHSPPIDLKVNECPDIVSVVGMDVGGCSVLMHVDASDPDHQPEPLSYTWSNGMTGPDPSLQCDEGGPVNLSLTVSDGDRASGCDAQFAVTVMCPASCGAPPESGDSGAAESSSNPDGDAADGASPDGGAVQVGL